MVNKVITAALLTFFMSVVCAIAHVSGIDTVSTTTLLIGVGEVGSPSNLSTLNATAARQIAWDKKLREDSVSPSVFTQLETAIKVIDSEISVINSGVFMKVDQATAGQSQSVRLFMGKPLMKAPQFGTSQTMLGNEDERSLLWTELYYNEIKKAVKYKKFGYDHNDTAHLKWVESYGPALITYMQELRDYRIHNALMLRYSPELIADPLNLAQQFNPNWVIPNLSDSSFPAWDLTDLTVTSGAIDSNGYYSSKTFSGASAFAENIAAALLDAAGTGSSGKALLNVDTLYGASEYIVSSLRIEPVMLDGIPTYIMLVPPRVKAWMLNPNNAGSLGEAFQKVADYKDPKRATLIGEIGRVCGNMVFVENFRAPTLTVGGSAGAYTLKPGFMCPGNNDTRNNSSWASDNYVFDMVIGLGANAVAEYLHDPLNTKLYENTEYSQIEGRGAYLGEGIQLPFWDKDTAGKADGANKTLVYRGSFLMPISRTDRFKVV